LISGPGFVTFPKSFNRETKGAGVQLDDFLRMLSFRIEIPDDGNQSVHNIEIG